jgi:hypothetical protein
MTEDLASRRRCLGRIAARWPAFAAKRVDRLRRWDRHGAAAEKVAENVLEDLFCDVLDWRLACFDLEDPLSLACLDEPMTALRESTGLATIDEVQHGPNCLRSPVGGTALRDYPRLCQIQMTSVSGTNSATVTRVKNGRVKSSGFSLKW